ncbi:porin family protein [Psychroflexus sediminis]|uniref:Outer membrane protein beta-barrel domain-containing protein n=1 Tax=Psychroflexus sediminis TaxID=470826 RepID=A0A1G7Y0H4_9FLAO|nr:porin family protein [Psychroflexus sediminis]SDG89884.1 Outer membrane protein beta-barrel domain-containing protein [Psychroflexus sediminis]
MKIIYLSVFLGLFCSSVAQERLSWLKENEVDSLYREDQFYLGFSFNFLTDLPAKVEQSGFSGGLIFGFIRDMPINKRRNLSIGLGLGFNLNTFGQTLQIKKGGDGEDQFIPIDSDRNYDSNRFTTNLIEIPLEFRWRSSDINKLSFWRIYLGFKIGYVIGSKSSFRGPNDSFSFKSIDSIHKFRTSTKLTFGYGAVNFFIDLSLNPIFDAEIDSTGEEVGIMPVKAGLTFFFL